MSKISTRAAYGEALAEIGSDPNIVVLDADLQCCTRTDKFAALYPQRARNVGIAEANMVGMAAGLATCGKTVFVNSFAMFTAGRAFEQILPHLDIIGHLNFLLYVFYRGAPRAGSRNLEHLQEGFQTGGQLTGVAGGVIGLHGQIGDIDLLTQLFDLEGLHTVGGAGLQIHLHNTVHLVLFHQLGQQLHALGIGGHHGAADLQIPLGNGLDDILSLSIHHLEGGLDAAAVFEADHNAAVFFNGLHSLLQDAADGAACDQNPLGAGKGRAVGIGLPRLHRRQSP